MEDARQHHRPERALPDDDDTLADELTAGQALVKVMEFARLRRYARAHTDTHYVVWKNDCVVRVSLDEFRSNPAQAARSMLDQLRDD